MQVDKWSVRELEMQMLIDNMSVNELEMQMEDWYFNKVERQVDNKSFNAEDMLMSIMN
ncbi:hypothetical protein DPMN_037042 [Dreissena polymorpha]|uniref:Uncharacterized protein n=1 Tax=Dreissena polymorpha TaxID=45954 RepID=A0A9D4MA76_DREPO|nr:hypothetical protein DPMN_037042 [Dreissena polymorpha]